MSKPIDLFTEEHYIKMKRYEHLYKEYEQTSSVVRLDHNLLEIMQDVHFALFGIRTNLSCYNCILELFQITFQIFRKYEANKNINGEVEGRAKRPRIQQPDRG